MPKGENLTTPNTLSEPLNVCPTKRKERGGAVLPSLMAASNESAVDPKVPRSDRMSLIAKLLLLNWLNHFASLHSDDLIADFESVASTARGSTALRGSDNFCKGMAKSIRPRGITLFPK